jgi:hypothetical protein
MGTGSAINEECLRNHNKIVSKSVPHYITRARARETEKAGARTRARAGPKMGRDGPKMAQDGPKIG